MRKIGKFLSVSLVLAGTVLFMVWLVASQSYEETAAEIINTITSNIGFDIHSVQYTVDGETYIGSRRSSVKA